MRTITRDATPTTDRFVHVMEEVEEWAIQSALAANRPLLVRGEPGIGKTQLAHAAATFLKRPLVSLTVDSRTESRELMWSFDAVQRLAEAQVVSSIIKDEKMLEERIHVRNFVRPGPLWWAYDWNSAKEQLASGDAAPHTPAGWNFDQGIVVLIDEIDKAESDVPNGLLEALGMRQFTPLGWSQPIALSAATKSPLIVITTNEERVLPSAFIRRCFVLNLEMHDVLSPSGSDQFIEFLIERGTAHFPKATEEILKTAAEMLVEDRQHAIERQTKPLPGQAEYLDFLRAVVELSRPKAKGGMGKDVDEIFKNIKSFVFNKSHERRR